MLGEVLVADAQLAQRTRQPERAHEIGHDARQRLAGAAHLRGEHRLPIAIDRLVVREHRRQHHARRVAMRDVEGGAERIADAVAGARARSAGRAEDRLPHAQLRLLPRRQRLRVLRDRG